MEFLCFSWLHEKHLGLPKWWSFRSLRLAFRAEHDAVNHRITEWPGVEGASRIMNLQPPCRAGPPTSPFTRPGCPGPHPTWPWTPPGMGHLQPLWAAVPAPHHSPGKELPPNIQPKSSLFQLKTVPPCPAVIYPFKEFTPFLFIGSLQVVRKAVQDYREIAGDSPSFIIYTSPQWQKKCIPIFHIKYNALNWSK